MKIGLVCPYNMFEHSGGVQEVVFKVAEGLKRKKHEVRIITPRPIGFHGVVPPDTILLGTSRRLNGVLSTAGDVAIEVDGDEIDEVLKREKFDVINFHEPWMPVLARQIINRTNNEALVATFHANLADTMAAKSLVNLMTPYGRGIGQKMDVLTATSPASAAVLINKSFNAAGQDLVNRLRYIPVGVDLKFFKPFKKRKPLNGANTESVVYIGRPDKRKGLYWLLVAFGELVAQMPQAHLIVAGDGSRMPKLRQYVKTQKIPNIKFLGRVSDDEKRRLLGNADLACFPALYGEGFGIVLVEAIAMGAPMLAGNNLGYQAVMKGRGRLGLIDPQATTDFANRMAVFLSDDGVAKMMSEWALSQAKQYDYAKIVNQYEEAYREALTVRRAKIANNFKEGQNGKHRRKVIHWLSLRRHARQ